MNKILFLKFKEPSHWTSCGLLLDEIELTYKKTFSDLEIIEIDFDESLWNRFADAVSSKHPTHIIFADHRFRIPFWIHLLKPKLEQQISWVIHAYGCFTGRVDEWMQLTQIAGNERFKIISASTAHTRIISSYFQNKDIVQTLRTPCVKNIFLYDDSVRKSFRTRFGIQENEIILCYTGRISYQKNVHHLIKALNLVRSEKFNITLFVAGNIDDKNPREVPHGYYLNHAGELFFKALSESKIPVTYLSQLNRFELNELYQGSDYAISLSTLYGEDYGLSLVESLSAGLGVIATNWGGHKDLSDLPQVKLIDVVLENETLKFDLDQLTHLLENLCPQDRIENTKKIEMHFNINAASKSLKSLFDSFGTLGGISKDAIMFSLKENKPWKEQEFFNLHEKLLQPYWS